MRQPSSDAPLRLTGLHVYPIKSAAGLAPAAWDVDGFGLRCDRRWMVVDAAGRMISQRTHPRLALVRPAIDEGTLRIETAGMPALELPLVPAPAVTTPATIWGDTCAAVWTGERAARWFSDVLETDCSLVHMPETTVRPADTTYAPPGYRVSFADGFAFLLVSEESLADLNGRMPEPLPMNRFRPNLVIAGGAPFGEDTLGSFRIGGLRFRVVKPCDRCVLTTTDQATAERGLEPLRTLATYRRRDGKVYFGQNVVHEGTGRLSVGDPLHAWPAPQ
jgi:MOSC domain-containing protein